MEVPSVSQMWREYQVPAEDLKVLESCFGKMPGSNNFHVWYQVDAGDHIRLGDWGFEDRTGVQVRDNCLVIQIRNEMMDNRCDWRFVFVKHEAMEVGLEAIRKIVTQ